MNATPQIHKTFTTVRGYELDSYGHVNNAVYLNYFEHGRWVMFKDMMLNEIIHQSNVMLVVTDVHIRYMRESKLYDELEIQTRASCVDPYLIFRQRVINRQTGLALARGEVKTIFIDKSRKPVDIPEKFKAIF